ncbi:MAG TPA: hypothetical protein DEA08_32610 [Planctomycetes bacterium]|nr:hypothetical protein [Planctomycetota bacterium]
MTDPLVGTIVDEWKITGVLGEGAMGAVYRAQKGRRFAAIKVAHPNKLSTDSLERFRREAQILMTIDDPYVVRCFAAGESPDFVYLALEYMGGGSLQDVLDKQGRLDLPQAVGVARRVLRGLAAVHAQGVVHRDVKPDNVLLDRRRRPKLADFSMARHKDHRKITATGTILGTADYMSPEQFSGKGADLRADLYAVGAMLYHMVAGKPPYQGRSSLSVLKQHRDSEIPDPAALDPNLKLLTKPIKTLMAKSADERPQDAMAALALFEGLPEAPLTGTAELTPLFGLAPLSDEEGGSRPSRLLDLLAFLSLALAGTACADVAARARGRDLLGEVEAISEWLPRLRPHIDQGWPVALGVALFLLVDRLVARRRGVGLLGTPFRGRSE